MKEQMLNDDVARRFWLGQLPPEDRGRIEELAFEDPETFTFLELVENDLIEEFIQGELSPVEEHQFKNHFLSLPASRENLKISRMLQRRFDKRVSFPDPPKSDWLLFGGWFKRQSAWVRIPMLAAAALALIAVAFWIVSLVWEARNPAPIQAGPDKPIVIPSPEVKVSPSPELAPSPAHVENKPKASTPERKRSAAYAVLLPSASPRGADAQPLKLPTDIASMPLELPLISQKNFRIYEAVLEDENGKVLYTWSNLKAEQLTSGKALQIDVPVTLLKPQNVYRIIVSGLSSKRVTERVARYPFRAHE